MIPPQEKLLPEVNIGMVGHVDHGKTTLTTALTGKWTSTHSEELKRGITIRLGYADATFYRCPKEGAYGTSKACPECSSECEIVRTVSFVDAPGHETLMATVLAGAALMDGALLIISANEACPQPQTREHLTALEIVGIKNIVIAQTKIDLVTEEQALKNHDEIKAFLKGSIAENAPIIPVSAQQNVNIGALIGAIEKRITTPNRDLSKPPIMYIARSFDVNKPGTAIESLKGGVIGGALVEGALKIGDAAEIRPGIKVKDSFEPVTVKVTGIRQAGMDLQEARPGGLLGISTEMDPYFTKSDALSGSILGLKDKLPPVLHQLTFTASLLERVIGSKEELTVAPIKAGDVLMLAVGPNRTVGSVSSPGKKVTVSLKMPVCAGKGQRVAISRQVAGRWRLIGWGEIV
ncbi:MAG: translation initiation factor IF-2 subunit gamma [Candidatus Aenigmarchaeota archaeon]|nr:translation initiation factor IF-2 subunit gamma [Candidatus Aenigmarchaeota archaeon]